MNDVYSVAKYVTLDARIISLGWSGFNPLYTFLHYRDHESNSSPSLFGRNGDQAFKDRIKLDEEEYEVENGRFPPPGGDYQDIKEKFPLKK